MENKTEIFTFDKKRICRHCGSPITDQAHALTDFCPRVELADHTIKSCKDDFHSSRNKEKNAPFLNIFHIQRNMHAQIQKLYLNKGDTVTTKQLDEYEIRLDMPVKFCNSDNKLIFYYIDFCLTQITETQFKISKHGNDF